MNLKLNDKGPAVTRLQELLNWTPFPKSESLEVDGHFGQKTEDAVKDYQAWANLDADGVVGPATKKLLWEAYGVDKETNYFEYNYKHEDGDVRVVDGRDVNKPPKNFYNQYREVNSVMLHQTGCGMPSRPDFWAKVNAHIGVLTDGTVVLMHSWDKLIWHGHGLSSKSIGIEIEGNFRGVEKWDNTYWKPGGGPHSITDAQIHSLNNYLFPYIKEYIEGHGNQWEYVYAHRQSSDQREADPGSKVWQKVGLVWQNELNIRSIDVTTGSGKPIPQEWDNLSTYKYWS